MLHNFAERQLKVYVDSNSGSYSNIVVTAVSLVA